jgi:hypothetical protein
MTEKVKKPIFKKWWFWVLVVVFIIIAAASCGGNDENSTATGDNSTNTAAQTTEINDKTVKKEIKASIDYYRTTLLKEIPNLADEKDLEGIKAKYREAIASLNADTDKYLAYMDDENLSDDVRQACEYMKTCSYGVSSTVLQPMLAVFEGESTDSPDYGRMVVNAETEYIDKAAQLIK